MSKKKSVNHHINESKNIRWPGLYKNRYYILAFVLPFLAYMIAYISMKVYPFGEREVQIIDSYHQYLPFFSEYYAKMTQGHNMFFSWKGGLGTNFWAIVAYYLSSPLNLILLVFPRKLLMEGFALIIMIKVGLCGWSFAYYISKHFKRYDMTIAVFGLCYALCGWMLGYSWNIMWLDCIVLFPLIILGLERLMKTGSGALYGSMLGLCIFCNYYISIMVCIFLVIYFFVLYVQRRNRSWKIFLRNGGRFALYSLLGGCMSMVMVLPELFALLKTHSAETSFPKAWECYESFLDVIGQQLPFMEPTNLSGLPNLYCGLIVLMGILLYIMKRKVALRKKISNILLLVFLIFSCNVNVLNYIWHGFHYPNNLPYRFTFIYIFILLAITYEVVMSMSHFNSIQYMTAFIISMLFVVSYYLYGGDKQKLYVYIIAMAGIWAYFMVMVLYKNIPQLRHIFMAIFCGLLVLETVSNAIFGLHENGTIDRTAYNEKLEASKVVRQVVGDDGEDQLYRTEVEDRHGRNHAMWLGFKSMSLFSSTLSDGLDHLMDQLGFFAATNKFSYEGSTRFTDNILGIRYLLADTYRSNIRGFDYRENADNYFLYENKDALSLGFMVDQTYEDWFIDSPYPWVVLNDFVSKTTGCEYTLFDEEYITGEPEAVGGEINREDNYTHYLQEDDSGEQTEAVYHINLTYNRERYIYFVAKHMDHLKVEINGESKRYDDTRGHIVDLGYCGPEDEITLRFKLDSDYQGGDIEVAMFSLDDQIYDEVMERLSGQQLVVDQYTDTTIEGHIDVTKAGIMYTSIPYDQGWSVYVDGQKTEVKSLQDSLMYIELPEGHHVIKMKYLPAGFLPGFGISMLSLLVFLILCFRNRVNHLKKICQIDV